MLEILHWSKHIAAELGLINYTIRPEIVAVDDYKQLNLGNEIWLIASSIVPINTEIIADNDIITTDESTTYASMNVWKHKHFTGNIFIQRPITGSSYNYEFLRIIPK